MNAKREKNQATALLFLSVGLLIAAVLLAPTAEAKSASVLLQEGLYEEDVKGDLDAAIAIYKKAAVEGVRSEKTAARAMYRIGMCYRKKGEKDQAADYFEQVTTRFPQQKDMVARAQKQLAKLRPPVNLKSTSGLVAHWTFDEGEGSIAHDSAGPSHGTIHGAQWVDGRVGSALQFDGEDDYVNIPVSEVFDFGTEDFSISVWFLSTGKKTQQLVTLRNNDNDPHIEIYNDPIIEGNLGTHILPGEVRIRYNGAEVLDGNWHHVAITLDNGSPNGYRLYLDGQKVGEDSYSGPLKNWDTVKFGERSKEDQSFRGIIDEVRFYNRALSETEIKQLYRITSGSAAGIAGFGPVVERTVRSLDDNPQDSFIDFETGRLITPPTELQKPEAKQAMNRWLTSDGADAGGYTIKQNGRVLGARLIGMGLHAVRVEEGLWNSITAAELRDSVANAPREPGVARLSHRTGQMPTYIFETYQKGFGILQIVDISDSKDGLKIRYKMVQEGAGTGPDLGKARAMVPVLNALGNSLEDAVDDKKDAEMGLVLVNKMIEQGRQFQGLVKGTAAEGPAKVFFDMLGPLKDALEKMDLERATTLLWTLNDLGDAADKALSTREAATLKATIHDNMGLDLDTGASVSLSGAQVGAKTVTSGLDVAWDNDGGGALIVIPGSGAHIIVLPGANNMQQASDTARASMDSLRKSESKGLLAKHSKFVAVLTDQGKLAVTEIISYGSEKGMIEWRLEELEAPVAGGFGPVFNRVIGEDSTVIDFETGKVLEIPRMLRNGPEEVIQQWVVDNGIDAGKDQELLGVDMAGERVPSAAWSQISAGELKVIAGEAGTFKGWVIMPKIGPYPPTYAFRTRDGGIGILQILDVTDAEAKIQYKMVSGDVPTAEAIDPKSVEKWKLGGLAKWHEAFRQERVDEHNKLAADKLAEHKKRFAEELSTEGWQLWEQRKLGEAEKVFKQAVEQDPGNANAWNGLGWSQFNQGKNLNAKHAFEKCLEVEPKHPAALNGLGWIAKAANKIDEAIGHWEKAIEAAPTATASLNGLATAYMERKDYDKAIKYYRMWLDAEPGNVDAKNGLSKAKAELKKAQDTKQ